MLSNLNDDTICRLCLKSGACNSIFTTLVSHRSSTMSCSQMIEYFVSSTIQEGDGLPCHICSECILKLETSYSFKKQCEQSYTYLINYYNNESSVNIKKEDLDLVNEQINDVGSTGKLEIKQIKYLPDDFNECSAIKLELNLEKWKTPKEDQKCPKLCENFNQCIYDKKVKDNHDSVSNFKQPEIFNEDCKREPIIFAVASLHGNNDSESSPSNYSKDKLFKKRNSKKSKKQLISKSVSQKAVKIDRTKEILGIDIHMLRTAEKQYQCNLCPRKFKYKRIIVRHIEKHLGIKSFFCKICQKYFAREWDHMQSHKPRIKKFQCDYCSKMFKNRSALNVHITIHTNDKPIKCNDCGKSFKGSKKLDAHKKIHSATKEFICQFCSKDFTMENYLKIHIKYKHTNERRYQCTLCEKRFVRRQNLKIHENSHLGIKNFHCDICNKSFVSKTSLTTHSKMHSGEKPYECRICSVKFKRSDHRNRHELTAHGANFRQSKPVN